MNARWHRLASARLLALTVAVAVIALGRLAVSPRPAFAMSLGLPQANCNGNTASVRFDWTVASGASQVWLDLSLADNGFAPGTFVSAGPLDPNSSSYTWSGILTSRVHYWRVNALMSSGWQPSATSAFVACGNPVLLWGPVTCTGPSTASVDFRWAPIADNSAQQWLDVGNDPNFAPGSFTGFGALYAPRQTQHWSEVATGGDYFFRINSQTADGKWHTSQTAGFSVECSSSSHPIYGSDDRLQMPRLGIDAPVNVRDVDWDGVLGVPLGRDDVVRYNFLFPGYGGYPGNGGTTLISGHVDYICCFAVFAPLRQVQNGDEIDYVRGVGVTVTYTVDWFADLPPDYNWNSLAASTAQDTIVLITCNGTFDQTARAYNQRRVVHAVRTN